MTTASWTQSTFAAPLQSLMYAIAASRRRRLVGAFVLFLVLTLLWNLPIALHPGTEVLRGPGDGTLSIRGNWAPSTQGKTVFTATHDFLYGAPEGVPVLNAAEWAQPVQVTVMLILHYAIGWIAAWNVFVMLGFLLSGFTGFLLLERMGFHPFTCVFGGYVLAFNPWMFERAEAGHAAFLHVWVFMAMVLMLLRMSETRGARAAAAAGLLWGLSFLFAAYFGLLGAVLIATYFVYEFFRVKGIGERLWTITLSCVAAGVCLVLLIPGLVAYARSHHVVAASISNTAGDAQRLGSDTAEYLLPDWRHPVFGSITRSFGSSRNFSEGTLFFGYTTMILAVVGVFLLAKRRAAVRNDEARWHGLVFAAILVPVAYWSSLKSIVHILGVPIPALAWFISHVTNYFRVYARFGILVGLGLVILSAPALDRIVRAGRRGKAAGALLLALVAFELLPGPITGWAAADPPAYDKWLARQPRGIVAHYPLPTDKVAANSLAESEIYYQMFATQPLYNLFGAGTGDTREDAIRILSRYITDPITPSILAGENVRYVVLHDDVYREEDETPPAAPPQLRLIRRFPNVRIYVLRRDTPKADVDSALNQNAAGIAAVQGLAAPLVSYGSAFSGTSKLILTGGGTVVLTNPNVNLKRVLVVMTASGRAGSSTVDLEFSDGTLIGKSTIANHATQVSFGPFPIGTGTTKLRLVVEGGGTVGLAPLLVQPLADYSTSLREG